MPISIVDVGHGNCTVVESHGIVMVIDAGPGSWLLAYLRQEGIGKLASVLVSHADDDHLRGLLGLLVAETFTIGEVHLNTDSVKKTKVWDNLV